VVGMVGNTLAATKKQVLGLSSLGWD